MEWSPAISSLYGAHGALFEKDTLCFLFVENQ